MFSSDYWEGVFIPFYQFILTLVVFLVVLTAVIVVITLVNKKKGNKLERSTKDLTYGAVCLALSFALSYIPLFKMPYGGTVTPASVLPLLIYCYYFGFRKSIAVTSAYMLLQLLQNPYIISPYSALLDYFIPYTSLCVMGIFFARPEKIRAVGEKSQLSAHKNFFIGASLYFVIRLFSHILSGVLFYTVGLDIDFMIWSGDLTGIAAWAYSLTYNALFLVPDTLIAIIAGIFVLKNRAFNSFMLSAVYTQDKNKIEY